MCLASRDHRQTTIQACYLFEDLRKNLLTIQLNQCEIQAFGFPALIRLIEGPEYFDHYRAFFCLLQKLDFIKASASGHGFKAVYLSVFLSVRNTSLGFASLSRFRVASAPFSGSVANPQLLSITKDQPAAAHQERFKGKTKVKSAF